MPSTSPFPGMDPYLELHWGDVHQSLVTYSRDQIQGQLPGDLFARVEERIYLAGEEGPGRSMYPDVRVTETESSGSVAVAMETEVAQALVVEVGDEPVTESFVEIRDAASGNRVITVVEFLSPTNKRSGPGRKLYLKKQEELKEGQVSSVEIDLVRQGDWTVAVPDFLIPASRRSTYRVCVWESWKPLRYLVYPLPLSMRLSVFPIPLRPTDPMVRLNLQALLDQAYRNGRYGGLLDYRQGLTPPLDPKEAAWADVLLREKGLR